MGKIFSTLRRLRTTSRVTWCYASIIFKRVRDVTFSLVDDRGNTVLILRRTFSARDGRKFRKATKMKWCSLNDMVPEGRAGRVCNSSRKRASLMRIAFSENAPRHIRQWLNDNNFEEGTKERRRKKTPDTRRRGKVRLAIAGVQSCHPAYSLWPERETMKNNFNLAK